MKPQFIVIGQQTDQVCDPCTKGNKQGKAYDCPDFLPRSILQTARRWGGSQAEFRGLAESRREKCEFREAEDCVLERMSVCRKRASEICMVVPWSLCWKQTQACGGCMSTRKAKTVSGELHGSQSSHRLWEPLITARVITGESVIPWVLQ